MSDDRVASLNEFIRDKHPGMVGIEVLSCAPHEVVGRLDVTEPLIAGTGFLWAPVVVTLADWLCACGTGENKAPEASFTTVELKTNFLRSVPAGGAIRGRATPAHVGRSTQVWDVEVADESSGKPIALFRCTQMILHPR